MARRVQNLQRSTFEVQFHLVPQRNEFAVFERVSEQADLVVQLTHFAENALRNSGPQKQLLVMPLRKPAE